MSARKWNGPKDNEVFAELEKRYLATRDKESFWLMYQLVQRYELRLIRQYIRVHGCYISPEDQQDLSGDMALWFMNRYVNDPEFKITGTMAAYGHWAFVKIMHNENRKGRDQMGRELEDLEVTEDQKMVIQDFETDSEKRDRWHNEKVAPGITQGILPIFGESNNENV